MKTAIQPFVKPLLRNEDGATSIEYAMIAAGISIAIISGIALISTNLTGLYNAVSAIM